MAKYRVLKPIEYGPGQVTKLYFPVDHFGVDQKSKQPMPPPTYKMPSACHGRDVEIDVSGFIELPDEIAKGLVLGQIAPIDGEPINTEYERLGKQLTAEQDKRGMENRVEGVGGKEKWVEGADRVVTPLSREGTLHVTGGKEVKP